MNARITSLVGLAGLLLLACPARAALVTVIAEDDDFALDGVTRLTSIAGYAGQRVINVWAVFDNPADQCVAVLGTPGFPMNIATQLGVGFVNTNMPASFDVPAIQPLVPIFPSLNFDSFVTLGLKFGDGTQLGLLPGFLGPNTDPWPATGGMNTGWIVPPSDGPTGGFNVQDLLEVLGNWGVMGGGAGDLNGDTAVDVLDIQTLLLGWGTGGVPTAQSVAGPTLRVLLMRVVVPPFIGPQNEVDFNIVVVGGPDGAFQSMPFTFSTGGPNPACGPGAGPCNMGNGTPGCDDPACCNLVCSMLPLCCAVTWDAICAGEAINQGCALPPGCMSGGEIPETEMCGTEQSGGCNATPTQYALAVCGEAYSGGVSNDKGVDEDWYQVDMPAGGDLIAELKSEFSGVLSIVAGVAEPGMPCPGPVVMGVQGNSLACFPGVASATDLPPGLYCIVVAPAQGQNLMCGASGTGYVMTPLPVPPVSPAGCVPQNRGACCLPTGNCMVTLTGDCATMGGTFAGLLSNCFFPQCMACCLGNDSCAYTKSAAQCTSLGGALQGISMAGDVADGQAIKACCFADGSCCRRLTQADCQSAGGTFQAFSSCVSCPPIDVCPWDVSGNGTVDVLDLVAVITSWGACVGCPADIDNNGNVSVADLTSVILHWGTCPPDVNCNS